MSVLVDLYTRVVLDRPRLTLLIAAVLVAGLAWFIPRFELDASADSLLLENDSDLRYFREMIKRYGSDDYLVVTYTARQDLFNNSTIADLMALRDELRAMENVDEVISMLDVPLIDSPRTTLAALQRQVPTLSDPEVDRELARIELRESPIYSNLLMSADGYTTAVLVRFRADEQLESLQVERDVLRDKLLSQEYSDEEQELEDQLTSRIKELRTLNMDRQRLDIATVREILLKHDSIAEIHLGGLPMIVSDMIDYIRNDIAVFGTGILIFLIVLLSVIFQRPRWVVIPLLCCLTSVLLMAGLLGLLEWRVTIVSSNIVALMLIFSLSLTVHLIQRYRELHADNPSEDQYRLVRSTLRDKALPCVFTAVTTMVGFGSLLVSGIRPVIDFGWMMMIGMIIVLITAFVVFPAALLLLSAGAPRDKGASTRPLTSVFATLVENHAASTTFAFIVLLVVSAAGISRLEVENRFIDYFKENTAIYQGMVTIDQELGGTMPLDIILDADQRFLDGLEAKNDSDLDSEFSDDDFYDVDFDNDFDADFGNELSAAQGATADLGATSYWYNNYRMEKVNEVHAYLDKLPETGKVLSMATTIETLKILNKDETPDTFFLSVLYNRLPENIKSALFDPYMSSDGNQMRLSVRILESDKELRRNQLLIDIRTQLVDVMGFHPDRVHITGMMVLYNNVLQSLYKSQIYTLGVVFIGVMIMFAMLFWSLKIAFIAIVPSFLSVGVVLGSMGLLGISLDIMTITIAAISVGIGVDNSIHYIYRYRQEMQVDGDATAAMHRSHASTGRAMFYTSMIIVAGFSILTLSNFIPSILFGLLTGVAMFMALVANLTVLPLLLKWARVG
jgi:predicted RND superfamily exporter protein